MLLVKKQDYEQVHLQQTKDYRFAKYDHLNTVMECSARYKPV